ncbi:tetratricopeptide repeat protein [Edaphobacter dinghuensis]|nr:tetratricopeptide repeat protein [Edaphobacter dinghuensis]
MVSVVIALMMLMLSAASAQQANPVFSGDETIHGIVLGVDGKPVSDADVLLSRKSAPRSLEMRTKADGAFVFSSIPSGSYQIAATKAGLQSQVVAILVSPKKNTEEIRLVLQEPGLASSYGASAQSETQTMEFTDKPNFTVAGVTDWTAVGGHGSDSILRTSESLAKDTVTLKPEDTDHATEGEALGPRGKMESEGKLRAALASSPNSFAANHALGEFYLRSKRYQEAIPLLEKAYRIDSANVGNQFSLGLAYEQSEEPSTARQHIHELLVDHQNSGLYQLMGELDEKLGDPLSAVDEYEKAVKLDPSEQNYFDWGSELLLHRAVWQAQEVFRKGAEAYPKSARMQTAIGTALFAGARYDEAAGHLCRAADLNPGDPNPYLFMGKIQMAAPNPLPCIEPKLAYFVQQEPTNSVANYLYAMSILKHQEASPNKQAVQQASSLLEKAVAIDPKCGEAYLQLGILSASQRSFDKAIDFYKKAIEANPQLADAHYRLAMAYDRTGQSSKAQQELQLHDQLKREQAEAVEQQRREVKQFLIVKSGDSVGPAMK